MHNTPLQNLEFQLAFTETNLRWMLGEEPRDIPLIEKTKAKISEIKANIGQVAKLADATDLKSVG